MIVNPAGQVADGVLILPVVKDSVHQQAWVEVWNPEGIQAVSTRQKNNWFLEVSVPATAFPETAGNFPEQLRLQITRVNVSPPRGIFAWSPMLVATYDYDLSRLARLILE